MGVRQLMRKKPRWRRAPLPANSIPNAAVPLPHHHLRCCWLTEFTKISPVLHLLHSHTIGQPASNRHLHLTYFKQSSSSSSIGLMNRERLLLLVEHLRSATINRYTVKRTLLCRSSGWLAGWVGVSLSQHSLLFFWGDFGGCGLWFIILTLEDGWRDD